MTLKKMQKLSKTDYFILICHSIDSFIRSVYTFLVPVLASLFFPTDNKLLSIIITYTLIIFSIFARPLGAFLFAVLTRSYHPIIIFSYSIIGAIIVSLLIAIIPTYQAINIIAPFTLIILKFLEAICSSGGSTIAELYVINNKIKKSAIMASYLYQMVSIGATIFASIVSVLVINSSQPNYYWRVPFFLSSFLGVIGYILFSLTIKKTYLLHSPLPFQFDFITNIKILWQYKITVLLVAVMSGFSYLIYYIGFIVINTFVPLITDISLNVMMESNVLLLFIDILALPIIGYVIKGFNLLKVMRYILIFFFLTFFPIWYFIKGASFCYIIFFRLWIIIIGITFTIPFRIFLTKLVNNNNKYLIIGMGNALGKSIIGQTTPVICLSLYYFSYNYIYIAFYIMIITFFSICALFFLS